SGDSPKKTEGVKDFKYISVESKDLEKTLQEISSAKELSFSLEKKDGKIRSISFSNKTGRAYYFPYSKELIELSKPLFENENISKIGYDLKDSYEMLSKEDVRLSGLAFDVVLAAYMLNPGKKIEFEKMILEELGEEVSFEKSKKGQLSMLGAEEDDKEAHRIPCQKADYCLKLKEVLEEKISTLSDQQEIDSGTTNSLRTLFEKMEMPLVEVLAKMELAGIKLNTIIFQGISEKLTTRLGNLEKSIYELAGKQFNINSPSQLSEILFEELKLPTYNIKKTKTKYSTASSELEKLKGEHKIIEKIEEYRELFKLKTTYLDALPQLVDENSRIHTTFNQAVTATGRLSSTEPNLQNIPIKTDLGKLLRNAFEAEQGYKLISADYSQIDLRAIAHVSEDKKLIEAFHKGEDIHKITAAEVNKVTLSQVTDTMRRNAKALNFGIIYGIGAFGFSQSAGITREEAQKFIDTYMEKFSGVAKYMKETREFIKKNGYVETILGRRRYLPEIKSPNFQVAAGAERMAINMPIQGLAADIVKLAMIKAQPLVESYGEKARAILQVHDEIIFEVKEEIADEFSKKAKEVMESVLALKVPLVVDVEIGDNWGEL
ncbi:MAG: polymerase protein, partial [Candidatus Moranbacteria bacterium GW2011_GWE1_49_15]